MKKVFLKTVAVFMAVLMTAVYLPVTEISSLFDVEASALITSDVSLGGNVKWKYDKGSKTITVYGSGNMKNFNNGDNGQRWSEIYKGTGERPTNKATKIVIENGVTNIGNNVFRTLNNVKSVSIPSSVTSIGQSAFEGCSALTTVNIPSSVKTIGNYAFKNTKVAAITIPSSVTSIGKNAFDGISGLKITCDYGSTAHSFCKTNSKAYKLSANTLVAETSLDTAAKQVVVTLKVAYNPAKLNAGNFTLTYNAAAVTPAITEPFYQSANGVATAIVNNGSGKISVAMMAENHVAYTANASECVFTLAEIRFNVTSQADKADFTIASDVLMMNDARTSLKSASGSINLHSFSDRTETEATCTQEGKIITECAVCGKSSEKTVPKNANNHVGGTTVTGKTEATCAVPGNTGNTTCNGCGVVISKGTEIPATGNHNYNKVVTAPTCTEKGYTTYTCKVCSNSYTADEVAALNHKYEAVVTAPTCTENGYTTYNCSVCGYSYKDNEVQAAHKYSTVVTAPTCSTKGFTTYTCDVCSYSYKADETDMISHNYNSVVTAPTCTEKGFTTYTCTVCSYSYKGNETDVIPHNYNSVVTAPTCTEKGFTTYTCTVCEYSYKGNETDVVPHNYNSVVTAPTCTEKGFTIYTCTVCEYSYKGNETDVVAHDYVKTITKTPTCQETGTEEFKCSNCNASYTQEIPVTDHVYNPVVTAPTCTEKGFTTYTCNCGDSYKADETPALEHSFDENGKCTICGFESISSVTFNSDRFIVNNETKTVIAKDTQTVADLKSKITIGSWIMTDAEGNAVADDTLVLPGYILKNENSGLAYTVIILGDVNRDGTITASDARKVLRITAELDDAQELDDLIVDCDFNERTTASDARLILRVSAELQTF